MDADPTTTAHLRPHIRADWLGGPVSRVLDLAGQWVSESKRHGKPRARSDPVEGSAELNAVRRGTGEVQGQVILEIETHPESLQAKSVLSQDSVHGGSLSCCSP